MWMILVVLPLVGPAQEKGVITTYKREWAMPVKLVVDQGDPAISVRLFVSTDRGRTWKLHSEIQAEVRQFRFRAEREELYWFSGQTLSQSGKLYPPDVSKNPPDMQIRVMGADRQEMDRLRARVQEQGQLLSAMASNYVSWILRQWRDLEANPAELRRLERKLSEEAGTSR